MNDQHTPQSPVQTADTREKDPVERLIELLAIDPATMSFAASAAAFIMAVAFHAAGAGALWCAIAAIVTLYVCLGLIALHRRSFLAGTGTTPAVAPAHT